ncbi:NF-X1-type Zn finger domain containing protein [Entamoeba histolytica]
MTEILAPTTQGQEIMEKLNKQTYECVICMVPIRRYHKIWSCPRCFTVVHSTCVVGWAANKPTWCCPVCRLEFDKPPKPSCFCGKHVEGSKYESAHCCGEICGKYRVGTNCPHPCTRKCHAGPCGPCTAGGKTVKCFCGRNVVHLGCGQDESSRSCGKMCMKELPCRHACIAICHDGPCPKCSVQVEKPCYCGKEKSKFSCGDCVQDPVTKGFYSCKNVCGKLLACGKHHCTKLCHSGPCEECPTPISIKTCACGKTHYNRKECTDPFEECPEICGKKLPCGHICHSKCHFGPCKCTEKIQKRCRCGKEIIEVPCGYEGEVTCENVCNDLLNCKVHRCDKKCCLAHGKINSDLHQCFNYCGKELPCGHKCMQICHGNKKCPPCSHMMLTPLTCRCGKTKIMPPIPCGTQPPQCNYPCLIIPPCGHPPVQHNCHFGPCPKCTSLTEKTCYCGKNKVKIPCYIESASCGQICGKPMPCGVHVCKRVCHDGPCTENGQCPYECGKKKPYCTHNCNSKCHGNTPCPTTPCDQLVEVKCGCGFRKVQVVCGATPEHPWQHRTIDCNLDCLKEHVRKEKVGVDKKRVDYPLWFLCLYDAAGRASKALETTIIEFINDIDKKSMMMQPMNYLVNLVFTYLCGYYQINIVPMVVKKSQRLMMEKQALRPVLCVPTVYDTLPLYRTLFHPKDNEFVVNVIVYDTDYGEQTMIIHLTQISEHAQEPIERFLSKIKYNCRQEPVNKSNIILFFEDIDSLEYAVNNFKKMKGFIVREDLLIPEEKEETLLQNEDKSFTDIALRIISGMLNEKFHNRDIVGKIMMNMPAYSRAALSNYSTTWKCLKEQKEPTLNLEMNTPPNFILKEMYIDFNVNRTQINQIVGYHDQILSFDMNLYIGASEDKRVQVQWNKDIGEGGKYFHFFKTISNEKEVSLLRRKKLFVWIEYKNKDVIGHRANVNLYFEARFLPLISQKKNKQPKK